jgi:hypothetical protein
MTAVAAHMMRQHRLVALAAILDLGRRYVMVAPAMALLGVRRSSLRDSHDS